MGVAKKKRVRRNVTFGVAHINASFNNITVTITVVLGECWNLWLQGEPEEHSLCRSNGCSTSS